MNKRIKQATKYAKEHKKETIVCIVSIILVYLILITFIVPKINLLKFKHRYEADLAVVLEDYNLTASSVKYTKLIPDWEKEYFESERINEYEVYVYIEEYCDEYEEIDDLLRDIRMDTSDYLLSNKYKILPSTAYVSNDINEKGFHEVNTVVVFEDMNEYKIDYVYLIKNGEKVFRKSKQYSSSSYTSGYSVDGGKKTRCGYPDCNSMTTNPYCSVHTCKYTGGCTNRVDPHEYCCYKHCCAEPGCSGHPYVAAGSEYCQTHYVKKY